MDNYEITTKIGQQIESVFTYHKPIVDQPERYVKLRDDAKSLAYTIVKNTPPSREQSLALTHLETAIFFANAAIARNEKEEVKHEVKEDIDPRRLPDINQPF